MKTKEDFAHYIAALAQRAILYEVSTTPKPGLVDRDNSGSHRDMDFFTFMASSTALYRGLYECTLEGLNFEGEDKTVLLDIIRRPGIECEKAMFEATGGVNTHKGIIFSMGIICAVVGCIYKKHGILKFKIEDICDEVKQVAGNLAERDLGRVHEKSSLTHGERLYIKHGFKGIRGEVESGFGSIRKSALKAMRDYGTIRKLSQNDLFIEILINLMAESEDTNVVIRGGVESLQYVKSIASSFLESGGMAQDGAMQKLHEINSDFIKRNISPGGSADLLAVCIFLGMLEGIIK